MAATLNRAFLCGARRPLGGATRLTRSSRAIARGLFITTKPARSRWSTSRLATNLGHFLVGVVRACGPDVSKGPESFPSPCGPLPAQLRRPPPWPARSAQRRLRPSAAQGRRCDGADWGKPTIRFWATKAPGASRRRSPLCYAASQPGAPSSASSTRPAARADIWRCP
jgi:hypothetical protein